MKLSASGSSTSNYGASQPAAAVRPPSLALLCLPALLVFVAGLVATLFAVREASARHRAAMDGELQRQGTNILNNFHTFTAHRVVFLGGVRGLFSSLTNFTRTQFEGYLAHSRGDTEDPAVLDLGFAPRIRAAEWSAFRERMLGEGFHPANFPERPHALDRDECFPTAYFTDQRSKSVVPLGFLLNSESNRLAAIRAACRSGETIATGGLRIFSADNQHDDSGLILFAPVYAVPPQTLSDPAARELATRGVVFVSLSARELWGQALQEFPDVAMRVYDGSERDPARLLFDSARQLPADAPPHIWYTMTGLGRDWTVAIIPLPSFKRHFASPNRRWLLAVGLVLTFGVSATMLVQALGRHRSARVAAELAVSQGRLKRREAALTALANLGQLLVEGRAPADWLTAALERLATSASADRVSLLRRPVAPAEPEVVRPMATWEGAGEQCELRWGDSGAVAGVVAGWVKQLEQDGFVVVQRAQFTGETPAWLVDSRARSLLVLPLWQDSRVAGCFVFCACQREVVWDTSELDLLRGGCLAVSLALKRAEAELQQAEEAQLLAVTIESVADAVLVTDPAGRIRLANDVALTSLGRRSGETIGRPLAAVLELCDRNGNHCVADLIQRALGQRQIEELPGNYSLTAAGGRTRAVSVSLAPLRDAEQKVHGAVLCLRDLTERLRLAEEQLRASKLESLGQLAGGLAHDFNNLLAAMLGNVSLARQLGHDPQELDECLTQAEKAIWRARGLTQQLLTFSKGGAPVARPCDLRVLAREGAETAAHGTNVFVEADFPDDLAIAEVDAGQLTQVFQNLALNSVQAMNGQGRIRLTARNVPVGAAGRPASLRGDAVCLTLRDQGPGLGAAAMEHLFEPYFTTRKGASGLGLATAYHIVRRHGGLLTLDSSPGEGAAFSVWLPASAKAPAVGPARPLPGGGALKGRLLIMDDDLAVQHIAVLLARRAGLEVAAAGHGSEAIELYGRAMTEGRPFSAVILDLTIAGGMGGLETIRRLRQLDPKVVAVVSSGYSNDPVLANFEAEGFRAILEKPYSADQFLTVLRQVMSA